MNDIPNRQSEVHYKIDITYSILKQVFYVTKLHSLDLIKEFNLTLIIIYFILELQEFPLQLILLVENFTKQYLDT